MEGIKFISVAYSNLAALIIAYEHLTLLLNSVSVLRSIIMTTYLQCNLLIVDK